MYTTGEAKQEAYNSTPGRPFPVAGNAQLAGQGCDPANTKTYAKAPSIREQLIDRIERVRRRHQAEEEKYYEMLRLIDKHPELAEMIDGLNNLGLLR